MDGTVVEPTTPVPRARDPGSYPSFAMNILFLNNTLSNYQHFQSNEQKGPNLFLS